MRGGTVHLENTIHQLDIACERKRMNTIYRVVLNVATGQWMVASELAKGRKKKASAGKAAVMALALAGAGMGMPVAFAADAMESTEEVQCRADEDPSETGCVEKTSATDASSISPRFAGGGGNDGSSGSNDLRTAIGSGVVVGADRAVGIGADLRVYSANAIALGRDFTIGGGTYDPAVDANSAGAFVVSPTGNGHAANSPNAIAILGNVVNSSGGIAIGNRSSVFFGNGVAIGENSLVYQPNSAALGANAQADGANSVALGAGSYVAFTQSNVVSVGNTTTQRRIVNMAAGKANTDAVNVGQVRSAVESLGATFDPDTGTFTGPMFSVQGGSPTNLVDTISALDSAVTTNTSDITSIKSTIEDLQAGVSNGITYDDSSKNVVTFGGAEGTLLTNIHDGIIGHGSMDAVNGGQLSDIRDQLQNQIGDLNDRVDNVEEAIGTGNPGGGSGTGNDAGGDPISNVGAGVADSDAVNVAQMNEQTQQAIATANSYTDAKFEAVTQALDTFKGEVNDRFIQQDARINRVGAMSAAMSQMAFSTQGINTPNRVGVGVGTQGGKNAIAVGYSRAIAPNINLSFGGSASGDETSAGAGLGVGW